MSVPEHSAGSRTSAALSKLLIIDAADWLKLSALLAFIAQNEPQLTSQLLIID